ncbi:MAG: SpoIIE family protein phosphatase [Thermoguttaceae bacterium]|nr:SpoIIE family protein phosphatase [Thermoguttaceae bacterium]
MEKLLIKNPDQSTQTILLKGDVYVVGRQHYCDVVLSNNAVSREHARLTRATKGWIIEDLQSRNGVWINGKRIEKPTLLRPQDAIQIGESTLVYQGGSSSNASANKTVVSDNILSWREGDLDESLIKSQVGVGDPGSSISLSSGKFRFRTLDDYEREYSLLEDRLRVMLSFGRILGKAEDVVDLVPRFLSNLLLLFPQADSACVIAESPEDGGDGQSAWKLLDYKLRNESSTRPFRVSRSIIRHVVATNNAIISDSPGDDLRFNSSESVVSSRIESVMAVPIYDSVNRKILGVIQIDSYSSGVHFENNELKLLVVVANQIAVYWENQMYRDDLAEKKAAYRELQVANMVQRGFLPSDSPDVKGYEFFDYYRPAKYVGGDYFDYIPLPDGTLAIVLGDVSGKGVQAALLMAKLSSEARYVLALEKTRASAMARLNRAFYGKWDNRFITFVMLALEPETGVVHVFNAGHNYPIVSNQDGSVARIGEGCNSFPFGMVQDAEYPEFVYRLAEGESISIMSDGLTDAMNADEEQFTEARVVDALQNPNSLDASQLGRKLVTEMQKFANGETQTDDQCLVVLRRRVRSDSSEPVEGLDDARFGSATRKSSLGDSDAR